ncbi:MAG TPA: hypothetical protein VM889_07595 [Candidatus Thermoplasmatota archaeon]|nr:hypothetical protein [Candidatus Thermoplasmatota archaeon]
MPATTATADARPLRDRTAVTKLLIMKQLVAGGPRTSQRAMAAALDVTVQAVSAYLHQMAKEKLLERDPAGGWTPTPRGIQTLQEGFRDLKRAVDGALADLAVVEAASALAATRVRAGERVGLFMEGGDLVARAGRASTSTGVAVADAAVGEEVLVRGLEGVVDLAPAPLVVLSVPGPLEGGLARLARRSVRAALRDRVPEGARYAVHGTGAKILAREMSLSPVLEFAPVAAAFNAAERGVPCALLVTSDLLKDALDELDHLNRGTLTRVRYDVVKLERSP